MRISPALEAGLKRLNENQREAVYHLDGPLLVLAGPGTGKTELLAIRAANIMIEREVGPENILCLTFSRDGTENMRTRLTSFIGEEADRITVSTYHEFGSYIIHNFPEYFRERDLLEPTDELYTYKILRDIKSTLHYSDALSYAEERSIKSLIQDVRLALLTLDDLRQIAEANAKQIAYVDDKIAKLFPPKMPGKLAQTKVYFDQLRDILESSPTTNLPNGAPSLVETYLETLSEAESQAEASGKSTPLSEFKNEIITKDGNQNYILKASKANDRLLSLANVYEQYMNRLMADGLYDYDDMILEAIRALELYPDLKYDLIERYQYILLDEYQDTNRAQARIVELLTDSAPENRPDVMAVGDDDQAIYAFQGAQSSNLRDFFERYDGTKLITLTENYRSSPEIIEFAKSLSAKIASSVTQMPVFNITEKPLLAAGKNADQSAVIERLDFKSPISENVWVADRIQQLIDSGVRPSEIAVLGREHSELVALSAQLNGRVPVSYAKRENILTDSKILNDLLLISELIVDIATNADHKADVLFPQVLSLERFDLNPGDIWQISWAARATRKPWSQTALDMESPVAPIVNKLLDLALQSQNKTMELMIDEIVKEFFARDISYELISHLTVLRKKLQTYTKQNEPIDLQNLINFVEDLRAIDASIINTSPYAADPNAITLMTAHSAKGLEWDYVFVINAVNEKWNKTGSKGKSLLPPNLRHIHPSGDSEDDRLRLLFVTLTRARHTLYITRSTGDFDARPKRSISYFDEREEKLSDGTDVIRSYTLPDKYSRVRTDSADSVPPSAESLQNNWLSAHLPPHTDLLAGLIADRVKRLQLAPTNVESFLDLEWPDDYGHRGPQKFYFGTILAFPHAMGISGAFGSAIHYIIEFIQKEEKENGKIPTLEEVTTCFENYNSKLTELTTDERRKNSEHAAIIIPELLAHHREIYGEMNDNVKLEQSFGKEGIAIDGVPITGRIDRLELHPATKTITVTDFKTGSYPEKSRNSSVKLYNYYRQLYYYKLLIENTPAYAGYTVTTGRLVFVDTDKNGEIKVETIDNFEPTKLTELKHIIKSVYQHILDNDYPDISDYGSKLTDVKKFETDLLSGTI